MNVRSGVDDDFVVSKEPEQLDKMDVENHYEIKKQEDCKGAPTPGTTATGHQREEAALGVHPACRGNVERFGSHPEDSCSVTQDTVSLSSGEAELKALNRGAAGIIQTSEILKGLGMEVKRRAYSDSSAGRGMTQRRGSGKVRHLEGRELWLQEKVRGASSRWSASARRRTRPTWVRST